MFICDSLFRFIYDFLKITQFGIPYAPSDRTFYVLAVISFIEISNIISIWPDKFSNGNLFFFYLILLAVNSILFYTNKRYEKVILNQEYRKLVTDVIWSIYSIGSLIILAIRTSFFY